MKAKKHFSVLKVLLCSISIAFFLVAVLSMALPIYRNSSLKRGFAQKEGAYPYGEAVKNGELDLEAVEDIFLPAITVALGYNHKETMKAPVTISYYRNIGDDTPAYVIEEGDPIWVKVVYGFTDEKTIFRGLESIACEKRGWRLAKPFMKPASYSTEGSGLLKTEGIVRNDELLYVKYNDLKAVAKEYMAMNYPGRRYFGYMHRDIPLTWMRSEDWLLCRFDYLVYTKGVYISPDLYSPVFSTITYVSLGFFIVFAGLYIWICKRSRQKDT